MRITITHETGDRWDQWTDEVTFADGLEAQALLDELRSDEEQGRSAPGSITVTGSTDDFAMTIGDERGDRWEDVGTVHQIEAVA